MKKNIIIGNGININYDKRRYDEKIGKNRPCEGNLKKGIPCWKDLAKICQEQFEDTLEHKNEYTNLKNPWFFILYQKWLELKRTVNLKSNSLEDYFEYFESMNKEIIKKHKGTKDFFKMYNESFDQIIYSLGSIYKWVISDVLLNRYKISEIHIPAKTIEYINKNFYKKITLNYDDNLNKLDTKNKLIHLHGKFNNEFVVYNGPSTKEILLEKIDKTIQIIKNTQKDQVIEQNEIEDLKFYPSQYHDWLEKKTLKADIIINNESEGKEFELNWMDNNEKLKKIFKKNFNQEIPSHWEKLENNGAIPTYKKVLSELEGEVYLLGMNPKNDQNIAKFLNDNKNIEKIIIYVDLENEKLEDWNIQFTKIIKYEHYNEFWNEAEK